MENDANNLDNMRSVQDISNIPINDIPNSNILTPSTEPSSENITGTIPEVPIEPTTEAVTEVPTEVVTEVPTEAVTEPASEVTTEVPSEVPTEVSTEPVNNEDKADAIKKKKQKQMIILIAIIVIIFAVGFVLKNKKKDVAPPQEEQSTILSKEEGEALSKDIVYKLIEVFEQQDKVFKVTQEETDEKEEYITVTDYDNVVKTIFTEKGLKEFEKTTFNKKTFVKKEEDGTVKLLKEIPEDNQYIDANVSITKIDIKEKEISVTLNITKYNMKDDILNYYVFVKELKLIKNEEDWLVDSFNYLNE